MSGLLDKANETAKTSQIETEVVTKSVSEDAVLTPDIGLDSGLDMTSIRYQLYAVFGFLLTMFLVFFLDNVVLFGDITLDDFFVPGVILCWVIFNAKELLEREFDVKKLGVSAVVFILVTAMVSVVAIFSASSGGVTIANIEYDGDNDEIDLSFYGPSGMDYTIEIHVDGKKEYSHDATINMDRGSHSVDLDDFWKGNSEDMTGKELIEYEIKVISDGGEDTMTFNDIMNREVDTAFISVLEKYTYDENGNNKVYEGIYIEMIVGIGSPNADFDFENGAFTGTVPQPIESDWTAQVRVLGGGEIVEYDITADEGVANGYGDFNFDWVSLHMGGGYLEKDAFYGEDGCYTFEITIDNEHGNTFVSTDSQIRFYWDENEVDNADEDKTAEGC